MAFRYVRSTDGANTDDGSTWALAKADLHTATTGALAELTGPGDVAYVSQSHAQSTNGVVTLTAQGTVANPTKILCVNDGGGTPAEPPTALATTGSVTTTSGNNLVVNGSVYIYGLILSSASALLLQNATTASWQHYEACKLRLSSNAAGDRIKVGPAQTSGQDDNGCKWVGCSVKFANAGQGINVQQGRFEWCGGSLEAGSTVPTALFIMLAGTEVMALVEGVDLSAVTTALVSVTAASTGRIIFRNCKLGAGVTVTTGTFPGPGAVEVWLDNCDQGDVNYRMERHSYLGIVSTNTSVLKAASDGTQGISWLMAPSANVGYTQPLYSPEMFTWNDTAGVQKTVTVEILQDAGTALHIDDVWLEVDYMGTDGVPMTTRVRDDAAAAIDVLDVVAGASTTALTSGAGTGAWTGEGGSAVSYKLVATITPQTKGFIRCRVAVATDVDVYVDPVVTVA